MIKLILAYLLALTLSSCSAFYTFKREAAVRAEEAADELLSDALYVICRGSTIGAIERRLTTEQQKAAREVLCGDA